VKKLDKQNYMFELMRILNEPFTSWKVRRALLVHKLGMSQEMAKKYVPDPPKEMDFHPGDY
jgi:hypothetical protein